MQFSQLNNDVVLEIFLQFVAIDWDGPFTLMLVCTKWSNLVVSQPRLWTWIMVDETQVEWRERMEVGGHLSKNLPLQIVLRLPFMSHISLSHITRRCSSLFVDSKCLEDSYSFEISRSWTNAIVSYEQFAERSAEFKQSSDSVLNFLKGAPIHEIQIRNEDQYNSSFAYSAWHVYERLNQRTCIQEVITSGETLIITALIFKHSESIPLPRIRVLVTDLWGVLPLLSNLYYLELADNYIRAPRDALLPHIQLRSLQTLKIESPMMGSVFFSLEDDVWLGLLSLLDFVTAPNLDDLSLYGPLHRIIATLIKSYGKFRLLQLTIWISVFDETVDQEQLDSKLIWNGLGRCSVYIDGQNEARRHPASELMDALRLLFNLIPRHCSVKLHGDSILEPILQSDLLRDVELHIVTSMGYSGDIHDPLGSPRKISSLSLVRNFSEGSNHVPWISSVEELRVEVESTLTCPNGPPIPMRVLACTAYTVLRPEIEPLSDDIRRDSFLNLTDIECDHDLAVWMITNHETPQLRSLTLSPNTGRYVSFSEVLNVVKQASHRLLSLDTLGIHAVLEWHYLLHFVANFNRTRGLGIVTVKLNEFPHPAVLYHLGRAFRGEADEPDILRGFLEYQAVRLARRYPGGCGLCILYGWSCYGKGHCTRWYGGAWVEITADMPLSEYEGDWGPDGQGLEHDLSSADESDVDAEHENTGCK